MNKSFFSMLALASLAALTACGGGSDGNGSNSTVANTPTLTGLYADSADSVFIAADGTTYALFSGNGGLFTGKLTVTSAAAVSGTLSNSTTGRTLNVTGTLNPSTKSIAFTAPAVTVAYDTNFDTQLVVGTASYHGVNESTGQTSVVNVSGTSLNATLDNGDNTSCVVTGTLATTGKAYETASFTYGAGCGKTTSDVGVVVALGNGYLLLTSTDAVAFALAQ